MGGCPFHGRLGGGGLHLAPAGGVGDVEVDVVRPVAADGEDRAGGNADSVAGLDAGRGR